MRIRSVHAKSEEEYEEIPWPVTAQHHSDILMVPPESGTVYQQGVTDAELTNNPAYVHESTIPEGTQGEQRDLTYYNL